MSLRDRIFNKIFKINIFNNVGNENDDTRVNWIQKTLEKIPANSKILDAGAGEQRFKKFCTHLQYVSQDFGEYKPEELKSGLQMNNWDYGKLDIISDIANIPEPNQSFDAIMCTEVFEHIINPREALVEFTRLLKPKGYLLLTAPFCSLTHFAPYHFYTGFNHFFYENELKSLGFKILDIQANGNYFEFVAQEVRRINQIARKYADAQLTSVEEKALEISLKALDRFSNLDKGSSELLSFGYHVFAQKK